MIYKMKKLTFLVYHKEYEDFLQQLRELGVVHVVEKQNGAPDSRLQSSIQTDSHYKNVLKEMTFKADKGVFATTIEKLPVEDLLSQYENLDAQVQEVSQQIPAIGKDIARMEVWGDFDWQSVRRLEEAGYHVAFYSSTERDYKQEWEEQYDVLPIAENGGHKYFMIISAEPAQIGIEPLHLPEQSLSQLKQNQAEATARLVELKEEQKAFCLKYYNTLDYYRTQLQADINLMQVRLDGEPQAEGAVMLMEGWIPENCEEKVRQCLADSGVYYDIREATRADNPPIKLKNNAFVRMYEVLTRMYGVPGYEEFDPTPLVAPFFSMFFAFCMGDAGYGIMLILLGAFLKRKVSPSMKGMMNLIMTLGVFTTVIGAILGTFFGVSLFDLQLPDGIKQYMIAGKIPGTNYDKQMALALIIGVIHISIAMVVKAVSATARFGFKNSLSDWGWLLVVVGSVVVGTLTFFKLLPAHVSTWLLIAIGGIGAIGIYLLNDLHRNVLLNIGAGLWGTYNMATGLMGDVLSYIRLYALGLAGGMLGSVFNQLAFMVNDGAGGGVLGWLGCGLVLVFGHTLNIAMSCLSAFVHPLRLNFVEFFKNAGYEGNGQEYKPFMAVGSEK